MPRKLQYFIIHCTATPEGRIVTPDDIRKWHLGPLHNADGTLTYKGKRYATIADLPNETIGEVPISQLKGRGWSQVGYSDMILLSGELINLVPYNDDQTVDPWEITNGATGINAVSRHIVYVGGLDKSGKVAKDTRNPAQRATMESWIRTTITFNPEIKGAGHNQFATKDCPSFFVPGWLKSIGIGDKNIFFK
jgi:N-acetylmuramoyl-L-alanine amidase